MADNKLFYGDNLEILRDKSKIPDESVDLCYIDPPFNSKRNYSQIYNNLGSEDTAQAQAFEDTWSWGDDARDGFEYILDVQNLQLGKTTPQLVELMRGLHKVLGESDLFAYLSHIALRVIEIRRVLKPTGSFYLHCDPTASHYLKLILDAVFVPGGGNYMNEIAWCYGSGGASKQHFSRKHDTIFWYVKGKIWTFNVDAVREPYSSPEKSMTPKVMNGKSYEKMHPLGRIPFDWWQIPILTNSAKERLGYPTQKPEALLERIVKASSNEGDVVLDAYCGCGTSVAVAQRLGRKWIGIDITYQSISLILLRMKAQFPSTWEAIETDLLLDGVPRDIASARALANRKDDKTRKEFEKWAVLTYSDDKARINSKKGADAGIDGVAFFMGAPGENGKAVIQVKSGKTDRGDIAKLNSDRQREKAEIGYLITLQEPTKPMKDEAAAAGVYKHPQFDRSDSRIQIVTVRELLNGARINLPMLRPDLIRSAESVEVDKTAVTMFDVDS